jgi:hypothetical protein
MIKFYTSLQAPPKIIYNKSMYLIFISRSKLEVFKGFQKVTEVSWTPENFSQVFSRLKSTFSSHFRVLLSDDFITIASLLVLPGDAKKRSIIQSKAQSLFNENLSQTVWDYKIVADQNNFKLIQVVAVSKTFFDQLRSAIAAAQIKIDLLESFSTAICRFLPKNKLIFLVHQNLLVLSFNQTPIFSQVLNQKITQEDINQIFSYSRERFHSLPQEILFSPTGDIAFNQFDFGNLQPEYTQADPLKGVIHSSNIHGSDDSTSRLEIKTPNSESQFPKILLIIPILSILAFLFVVFSDQILPSKKDTTQINPVIQVTPTAIPTITAVDPKSFQIEVLNGSGARGEAAKIANLLTPDNFVVAKADNAANFNFTQTQIEVKSTVPDSIIILLTKSLSGQYIPKISSTKLDSSSPFDIIITTGK